jgi:hypothetical protein
MKAIVHRVKTEAEIVEGFFDWLCDAAKARSEVIGAIV